MFALFPYLSLPVTLGRRLGPVFSPYIGPGFGPRWPSPTRQPASSAAAFPAFAISATACLLSTLSAKGRGILSQQLIRLPPRSQKMYVSTPDGDCCRPLGRDPSATSIVSGAWYFGRDSMRRPYLAVMVTVCCNFPHLLQCWAAVYTELFEEISHLTWLSATERSENPCTQSLCEPTSSFTPSQEDGHGQPHLLQPN